MTFVRNPNVTILLDDANSPNELPDTVKLGPIASLTQTGHFQSLLLKTSQQIAESLIMAGIANNTTHEQHYIDLQKELSNFVGSIKNRPIDQTLIDGMMDLHRRAHLNPSEPSL